MFYKLPLAINDTTFIGEFPIASLRNSISGTYTYQISQSSHYNYHEDKYDCFPGTIIHLDSPMILLEYSYTWRSLYMRHPVDSLL